MFLLSDFLEKPLLCLTSGKILGKVADANFDERLSYLKQLLFWADSKLFAVNFEDVAVGDDAILVDEGKQPVEILHDIVLAKNIIVFDHLGKSFGKILDVKIVAKGKVEKFVCQDFEFDHKIILSQSTNTFVVCDNPPMLKSLRRKRTLLQKQRYCEGEENAKNDNICKNYFGFLIGRKVLKDIFVGGEILVKKSQIISQKTIDICKSTQKLVMLAKFSK